MPGINSQVCSLADHLRKLRSGGNLSVESAPLYTWLLTAVEMKVYFGQPSWIQASSPSGTGRFLLRPVFGTLVSCVIDLTSIFAEDL